MKRYAIILIVTLFAFSSKAQTRNPLLAVQAQISRADSSSAFPDYSDTTALYYTHLKLFLMDTVGISKIHISIKRNKDASSEVYQHVFDFDVSGSGYSRNKRTVDLDLGQLAGVFHLYVEAKIEKTNGTLMPAVTFTR